MAGFASKWHNGPLHIKALLVLSHGTSYDKRWWGDPGSPHYWQPRKCFSWILLGHDSKHSWMWLMGHPSSCTGSGRGRHPPALRGVHKGRHWCGATREAPEVNPLSIYPLEARLATACLQDVGSNLFMIFQRTLLRNQRSPGSTLILKGKSNYCESVGC